MTVDVRYMLIPDLEEGATTLELQDRRGQGGTDPEGGIYLTWRELGAEIVERHVEMTPQDLAEFAAIAKVMLGTATDEDQALVAGLAAAGAPRLRSVD